MMLPWESIRLNVIIETLSFVVAIYVHLIELTGFSILG
jgi:hypothetical protein